MQPRVLSLDESNEILYWDSQKLPSLSSALKSPSKQTSSSEPLSGGIYLKDVQEVIREPFPNVPVSKKNCCFSLVTRFG